MSINQTSTALISSDQLLDVVLEITRQIHQAGSLGDILHQAVKATRTLLQTDRVIIYRCLPENQVLVSAESVGGEWTSILGQLIDDPCFAITWEEAQQQGQTRAINAIETIPAATYPGEQLNNLQVQASLGMPIVCRENLWGVLIVHHYQTPRNWQSLEVKFLQQLALQVGIAIQQAEMQQQQQLSSHPVDWVCTSAAFTSLDHCSAAIASVNLSDRKWAEIALRQQAERERLIAGIAQNIRQTLDLDAILNTTVSEIRHFLQTDRVIIYRLEEDWSGTVITESVAAEWQSILGMKITDTYFVENQHQLNQLGKITATENVHTADLTPCHLDLLVRLQVKAKLTVPILQGNNFWGLLVAHHCQSPRQWQSWKLELLPQLATQVGIAIQQSELHLQVQRLNADLEKQVKLRTSQLNLAFEFEATLKRITDKVRDSLDEAQIMHTVLRELALAIQVNCCNASIYNLEQETSTVRYEYTTLPYSYEGRVVQMSGYPEIYSQLLRGDSFQCCSISPNSERGEVMMLAYPIADDQGILGDLWLINQKYYVFSEQDIRLVQQVATQCAIALRQSRLYQAAQSQVEELEHLNQLKDDFLSTVSHELRSPMSSIKMAIQMLEISLLPEEGVTHDMSQIHRYLKILKQECQREIHLINDLLDLARLDAGTETLNLTTVNLQDYLPSLAESFTDRIRSQKQQLEIQIPADLPEFITDLAYLERILTELLHNACKYTPTGETITLSAQDTLTGLEIQVRNTGVEVSEPEQRRIFDKFYRIPNNDPWKHGGTGLGLALVKKLTEALGAIIKVESGDRQTAFILHFVHSENLTVSSRRVFNGSTNQR